MQPGLLTSSSPLTPDLNVGNGHTNQQAYTVTGTAEPDRDIQVYLNGSLDGTVVSDAGGNFSHPVTLLAGANEVYGVAVNGAETSLPYKTWSVVYDIDPPQITLTSPPEGGFTNYATFVGQLDESGTLAIDGNAVPVKADNSFTAMISTLPQGQHTVQLVATDLAGNSTVLDRSFTLDSVPPANPDTTLIGVGTPAGGTVTVSARPAAPRKAIRSCSPTAAPVSRAITRGHRRQLQYCHRRTGR